MFEITNMQHLETAVTPEPIGISTNGFQHHKIQYFYFRIIISGSYRP